MGWIDELKRIKRESGMTIDEIAAASGVPKSTAAKVLAGGIPNPKVTTLRSLLHAMGKTLDDLEPERSKKEAPVLCEQELTIEDMRLLALPQDVKQTLLQLVDQLTDIASLPIVTPTEIGAARVRKAIAEADAQAAAGAKQDDCGTPGQLSR